MSLTRRNLWIAFVFVAVMACTVGAQTRTADNGNGTFTNPLFYEEFSDPDMIRVGSDFYLTGTTMHSMPGLPILRSKDLVNWSFIGYAVDTLDLGPSFRLEDGKNEYSRGIWAPCLRFHNGTFYIFSNVNGQTTQLFRATNPAGPWTRTPMKRSLHDLSVLFDDDGRAWVVWGYQGIRIAQLTPDLTDTVPGSERELIPPKAGMGEGLHLYKIKGKYFLTSAWFNDEMRMPVARADTLEGPWEVNQEVSRGEDFGVGVGYWANNRQPPFRITPPDSSKPGRCAIHQGGLVDTPTGEWWGFSMMDANSIGRMTALSPITWTDGWPYFGLPGNLGRTPRTWVKPNTGTSDTRHSPYRHSDDFSAAKLRPIWQWNHVPVDGKWSLTERPGFLRLRALPASDLWRARNTLTQRGVGPRSTVTVALDASGLKPGDAAGLALFIRPYAWVGVERTNDGLFVTHFDEQTGTATRVPLAGTRVWLRADCDFVKHTSVFRFSADGVTYSDIGGTFVMAYSLITFQGVRTSLFAFNTSGGEGGTADFDAVTVVEEPARAIPYGKTIELRGHSGGQRLDVDGVARFTVRDRGLGRVALEAGGRYLSVDTDKAVTLRRGTPGPAETFQWIETFSGEVTLMSLATARYVRVSQADGKAFADSRGPLPDGSDGVRFAWPTNGAGAPKGLQH